MVFLSIVGILMLLLKLLTSRSNINNVNEVYLVCENFAKTQGHRAMIKRFMLCYMLNNGYNKS